MTKATKKNPFTALGFAPSAFEGLLDSDVRNLLKSQYRTLMQIHHPDHGGNPDSFRQVQEAMDALNEDFEFDYWKKMFLRPKKDQMEALARERDEVVREAKALKESLALFWQALCQGRKVFHPASEGVLGQLTTGFSIFDPPACCVLIGSFYNKRLNRQAVGGVQDIWKTRQLELLELMIFPDNSLYARPLKTVQFDPQKEDMPRVRREWIKLCEVPSSKSTYYVPTGELAILQSRLVGSLPSRCFSDDFMKEQAPGVAGLLPHDVRSLDFQIADEGFTLPEFQPYFRFLQPYVLLSNHIVLANKEEDPRLRIVGSVRQIYPHVEES